MREIGRVNGVVCPNRKYRYYVGASWLMIEGVPAIWPKCHHELEAQAHLVPEVKNTRKFVKEACI